MQLAKPWIDPSTCGMEDVLHKSSYHLVFLLNDRTDKFDLVDEDGLRSAHFDELSTYTTNMLALSIDKDEIELTESGKISTNVIPRTKIEIDTVFVDLEDMKLKLDLAVKQYFEYV